MAPLRRCSFSRHSTSSRNQCHTSCVGMQSLAARRGSRCARACSLIDVGLLLLATNRKVARSMLEELFVEPSSGKLAVLHDARGAELPLVSMAFAGEIARGAHSALAKAAEAQLGDDAWRGDVTRALESLANASAQQKNGAQNDDAAGWSIAALTSW